MGGFQSRREPESPPESPPPPPATSKPKDEESPCTKSLRRAGLPRHRNRASFHSTFLSNCKKCYVTRVTAQLHAKGCASKDKPGVRIRGA